MSKFKSLMEGIETVMSEEKWSAKVQTKWSPPEGFFKQDAGKIASGLMSASKDGAQAMERLNFYINRGGENLSAEDKARLEDAKKKLSAMIENGASEDADGTGDEIVEESKVGISQIAKAAQRIGSKIEKMFAAEMEKMGVKKEWDEGWLHHYISPIIVATVVSRGGEVDSGALTSAKTMAKSMLKILSKGDSAEMGMGEAVTTAVGNAVIDKIMTAMLGTKFDAMIERHLPESDFPGLKQSIIDAAGAAMKQALVQYGLRVTGASAAGKAMRALIKKGE